MKHVVHFIIIVLLALLLPWWLFLPCAALYGFLYDGVELIFLGVFLDAYLGIPVPWLPLPLVYTFSLSGIVIALVGLKPLFSWYEVS